MIDRKFALSGLAEKPSQKQAERSISTIGDFQPAGWASKL
jgi:hypothetical protein